LHQIYIFIGEFARRNLIHSGKIEIYQGLKTSSILGQSLAQALKIHRDLRRFGKGASDTYFPERRTKTTDGRAH
jgi:hypothetical protein